MNRAATTTRCRAVRVWFSLTAVVAVLGLGSLAADAGAQQDGSSLRVDRVDATGDAVLVSGSLEGVDADQLEVSSSGDEVPVEDVRSVAGGELRNEVVVVIDNAESLGNATVQLAKQALDPLFPGQGAVELLGVVTTGGGAAVQVGPTSSASRVADALEGIGPVGTSATWDGITRAAELLESRDEGTVGTVLLISGSPNAAGTPQPGRADGALLRADARLDVVALPGAPVRGLAALVGDAGGVVEQVDSDAELAGAVEEVASSLANRFQVVAQEVGGSDNLVPLTVTAGDATTEVAYTPGSLRTGSIELAPIDDSGSSLFANAFVKYLIVLLGVAAAILLVWSLAAILVPDQNDLRRRLRAYDEAFGAPKPEPEEGDESRSTVPILQKAVDFTGEMAEKRGVLDKVETMLERANLPLRAPEAMFFTAIGAAVVVVLSLFLTGNLLIAVVVALFASLMPGAVLNFRIRKRQKAFLAQLPDMLTLLAGTLRAGYSIGQGFESVSKEVDDPMGRELRRVVTETRLGRSLEESLEAVASRMDSDDFSWAVMAIRIQREVGGNLAELLLTVADTMTQRERLRREVSTLTAEGRMSAIIIGALPPGLAAVMFAMNPEYISELFTPGLGYALVITAIISMVIGFLWMKKTITIEV